MIIDWRVRRMGRFAAMTMYAVLLTILAALLLCKAFIPRVAEVTTGIKQIDLFIHPKEKDQKESPVAEKYEREDQEERIEVGGIKGGEKGSDAINLSSRSQDNQQIRKIEESLVIGKDQEDPEVIKFVRGRLLPPSNLPYNLTDYYKTHYSQTGQSKYLDDTYLHGMRNGFFVEVGALNGEYLSNTLYFEKTLNWTGLLVEPMPYNYKELQHKHRRAYTIRAALATNKFPTFLDLWKTGEKMKTSQFMEWKQREKHPNLVERVISIPFYSMLRALNVTQIDFLSLDIEALELKVLQTLPWDKIKVRIMCIECNKVRPDSLDEFLNPLGYQSLGRRNIDCWYGLPSLLPHLPKHSLTESE